jgi:hypothetical protein
MAKKIVAEQFEQLAYMADTTYFIAHNKLQLNDCLMIFCAKPTVRLYMICLVARAISEFPTVQISEGYQQGEEKL